MNLELVEQMTELLNTRRARRTELAEEYKTAKGLDAKRIYDEVAEIVEGNNEINRTIKALREADAKYMNASTLEERNSACDELVEKQEKLYLLAEKYGVNIDLSVEEDLEEEPEEIEDDFIDAEIEEISTEKKKNHTLKNIAVGTMLFGLGAGVTSCVYNQNQDKTQLETESQLNEDDVTETEKEVEEEFKDLEDPKPTVEETEPEKEEIKIENVDTELYGMTSAFTDASNEEQVMQRATDIYNVYVNIEGMPEAMKQQLSVERIANFIRMANGEFALEDGKIDYNSSMFDEMGNFINSYYNSTSFVEFGTDLQFKPGCVFYENDSLAHHSAAQSDVLVKAVYEDIKNNDVEQFQKDAVAWGEFVRDTVIYNDFTGETISLWSMENEQKYPLIKTLTSVYAPSIMEYSLGVDLANRDSSTTQFGNTFGICIPFCYNSENELEYMPISEMIYHINETPINHLAERAGYGEEWAAANESLMVQAGLSTMSYFDAKYAMEVGNSLTRK